jgi:L-iditol 2-dehydrogenase
LLSKKSRLIMKSLRIHGIGDFRLHDEPIPSPDYNEVLIRVKAVGICGSDIHWVADGTTGETSLETPLVLGHEFGGVVEGGNLDGLRVAVDPQVPCDTCEYCLQGNPNLCPDHDFAGHPPHDGALREYMAWPMKAVVPIPDSISDEDAAVLEPLGVAIHTVDLGHVKPGMAVGVYGCGPIGLLAIQVARAAGASEIIATDILPHRLDAAKAMGADRVYLASPLGGERTPILTDTHREGVDVALEVAGENAAVETAIETVKPGGRVVLCGIPTVNEISFKASSARRKGLSIMMVRRMKHVYPRAIRMVEAGQVDVRSVVSHQFSLEQAVQAFELAQQRQGLKIIINP